MFNSCEKSAQIAILHFVCSEAASQNSLNDEDAIEALRTVKKANSNQSVSEKLKQLSEDFDGQYFELQDKVPKDAHVFFQRARAASALSIGTSCDSNLSEALYEAIYALPDHETLVPELIGKLA